MKRVLKKGKSHNSNYELQLQPEELCVSDLGVEVICKIVIICSVGVINNSSVAGFSERKPPLCFIFSVSEP